MFAGIVYIFAMYIPPWTWKVNHYYNQGIYYLADMKLRRANSVHSKKSLVYIPCVFWKKILFFKDSRFESFSAFLKTFLAISTLIFYQFSGNFIQRSTLCLRFLMHLGILASHSTSRWMHFGSNAFLHLILFTSGPIYLSILFLRILLLQIIFQILLTLIFEIFYDYCASNLLS